MASRILITGATGTLGKVLVPLLQNAGQDLRLLSRSAQPSDGQLEWVRGDVSTGQGLDDAFRDVHTVVHCAGSQHGDGDKARNVLSAATRAGVEHIVHVSVVGADTVPVVSAVDRAMFGYFAAKREAEEVISGSAIGWTMLRPTQFHEFVTTVLDQMIKLPVLPLWRGVRFQPVDIQDVAGRLAELALGEPAGIVPSLGGPKIYPMDRLARDYLAAIGRRRLIMNLRTPGRASAAFRAGANLTPDHADGVGTWESFLARKFPASPAGASRSRRQLA
jgi:uncharacterized protein YbjT (DUF2867 family)